MKFTSEIIINLPRTKVVELFDSAENLHKWQPELISFKHLSGEQGKSGAQSRLIYKMGKREVEMIETITKNNLPEEFSGTYQAKGVMNWVSNHFEELEDGSTKWISENEFELKGFMVLMGWFMPGAFKKQCLKYMVQFKEFAEKAVT